MFLWTWVSTNAVAEGNGGRALGYQIHVVMEGTDFKDAVALTYGALLGCSS